MQIRTMMLCGTLSNGETGTALLRDSYKSGQQCKLVICMEQHGSFQLRVKATDSRGTSSDWSDPLDIVAMANARPNAPLNIFGPSSGYSRMTMNYFTLAEDPDKDNVTYTFDWGDGNNSTTDSKRSGSVENGAHSWTKSGKYDIKACAIDSKGASSSWSPFKTVTIADNDPPNSPSTPSGPISGNTITSYSYTMSADDPDGDRVRYVFDWGDGTTSWTGLEFISSGTNESVTHRWNKGGVYRIRAMAMDEKGASSRWSDALEVNISLG